MSSSNSCLIGASFAAVVLLPACAEVVSSEPVSPSDEGSCRFGFGARNTLTHAGEEGIGSIAVDDTHLYWTSIDKLQRVAKTGSAGEIVASGSTPRNVVAMESQVVWSETDDDGSYRIVRLASASGGPPEVVATKISIDIGAIAILEGDVYWVDVAYPTPGGTGVPVEVHRASGGAVVTVGRVEDGGRTGALHAHGSGLYFTNGYTSDRAEVHRLDWVTLDGARQAALAQSAEAVQAAFVGDVAYLTEVGANEGTERASIVELSLPEGPRRVLFDPALAPDAGRVEALAADDRRVFWAKENGDIAARCVEAETSGEAHAVLENDEGDVRRMISDGATLYFTFTRDATDNRIESVALQP